MKKIIDKFLIKRSIRPYKVIALSTGVIVEHYRNGKLKNRILWIGIAHPDYKEYECTECGADIDKPGVCSGTCHEASMI